jgi:hypothetical protein
VRFKIDDDEFDMLSESDLMWAEAAHLERVVGKTLAQIQAAGQFCGCDHHLSLHVRDNPDDLESDIHCKTCGCENPAENVPIEVSQALMWISLKRVRPTVSFSEVGQMPMSAFTVVVEAPDPTAGDEVSEATPLPVA